MNGIEKITDRISADASAEIDRLMAEAKARSSDIAAKYRAQADAEAADLAARNAKAAAEREERLVSVAQMESRKTLLAAKQEMVGRAYDAALEKLCAMPDEQYVEVLASLLVQASSTGREEVVFSPEDRERVGKAAVARANELLSGPKPEKLVDKVAASVAAIVKGGEQLTLSGETRPIRGGFILKDANVEVNCTFDTLVRLQRAETAGTVAKTLFPEV